MRSPSGAPSNGAELTGSLARADQAPAWYQPRAPFTPASLYLLSHFAADVNKVVPIATPGSGGGGGFSGGGGGGSLAAVDWQPTHLCWVEYSPWPTHPGLRQRRSWFFTHRTQNRLIYAQQPAGFAQLLTRRVGIAIRVIGDHQALRTI